jgi:hypothetical protein
MEFFKFLRQCFSESDGTGSMTRLLMFSTVLGTLGLLGYVTAKTGGFPNDGTISALTSFAVSISGVLYGTNKAAEILETLKGAFAPKSKDEPAK